MNPALQLLRDYESRNVTHLAEDGSWPIVWDRAKGVHVWDTDGKKYLDLTAAFAVAVGCPGTVVAAGAVAVGTSAAGAVAVGGSDVDVGGLVGVAASPPQARATTAMVAASIVSMGLSLYTRRNLISPPKRILGEGYHRGLLLSIDLSLYILQIANTRGYR